MAHEMAPENATGTEKALLWALTGFTAVSIFGYWFFALHPENLALPGAAEFYAVSFRFFAQTHVWLSGVVLLIVLAGRIRLQWIAAFAAVYVLSLSSEMLGTNTGFPFGAYSYSELLGSKWFGHVPIVIPLSWFTMAVPSFVIVDRYIGNRPTWMRWSYAAVLLTIWDLALDPAMSFLAPYWSWANPGMYYGMPAVNLLGWFATGVVLMAAIELLGGRNWGRGLSTGWLASYYGVLVLLPIGLLVAAGAWPAVGVTAAALAIAAAGLRAMKSGGSAFDEPNDEDAHAGTIAPDDSAMVQRHAESAKLDKHEIESVLQAARSSWRYFRHHSRSFSFASIFFAGHDRRTVSRLYALCRISDDVVDESNGHTLEERIRRARAWRYVVMGSFHGHASGIDWLDDILAALQRSGMSEHVLVDLFDGVESDLGRVRVKTLEELRTYAYRVASTVGIMMCYLFDETEPWKLSRAASLGRAMQLTNILRDVGRDLDMDRIYLPAELLDKYGLDEQDLSDMKRTGIRTVEYTTLIYEMERYAEMEYARAWEAIPQLSGRFGPSVGVAASIYRGIHGRIQSNGYDNLGRRAWTRSYHKAWLASAGLLRYGLKRTALKLKHLLAPVRSRMRVIVDRMRTA